MKHCENCHQYRECFDYDDWSGTVMDFCKCGLTGDLIDCSEAEHCEDYEPID